MKNTMYFKSVEEMNQYFPNGVPNTVIAICGEKTDSKVLYTSSNNEVVGGVIQGGYHSSPDTVERLSYLEEMVITLEGEIPEGYTYISTNGDHDIASYAYVNVNVPVPSGYIVPDGTKEISVNGDYDVSSYANVTVAIEGQTEFPSKEITENGHVNVASYGFAYVSVPVDWNEVTTAGYIVPAGTKEITENGSNIDVASYSNVNVSVPVPSGYVLPAGTKEISENGSNIDVASYSNVNVSVPVPSGYVLPSGTRNISESGTFDVTTYASAYVDIPRGIDYTEVSTIHRASSDNLFDNIENGTDVDVKVILGPNTLVTPFSNLIGLDSTFNTNGFFASHPSYYAIQPIQTEPIFIVSTTLPSGWSQEGVYSVKGKSLTFESTFESDNTLNLITEVSSISAVAEGGLGTNQITSNGDYTVNDYYKVSVSVDTDWNEVAIAGYVLPVGTYNISDNGTFDISSYESAYVDVHPFDYPVVNFPYYNEATGTSWNWSFEDGEVVRLSALLYGRSDNSLEVYPISALSYLESNYETNDYITNHPNSYIVLTGTPHAEGEPYLVFDYDPTNPPSGKGGVPYFTGVYSIKGSTLTWYEKGSDSESSSSSGSTSGIELGAIRLLEQISSIERIDEGGAGTLNISDNGTYDVTTYSSAYVNVSGGGSEGHGGTSATDAFTVDEANAYIMNFDDSTVHQYGPEDNYPYLEGTISYVYPNRAFSSASKSARFILTRDGSAPDMTNWSNCVVCWNINSRTVNGYTMANPEHYYTDTWNEDLDCQVHVGDRVLLRAEKLQKYNNNQPEFISGWLVQHTTQAEGQLPINNNGTYNTTSYVSTYVNVSGGGGIEYIFLDPEVDTKTAGSYYEFNGQLNSTYMMQITSEFVQSYPSLEPYIGCYVTSINGDEINPQSTGHWSETCIIENAYGLWSKPVIAKGQYVELITGNPMFIIDSLEQAKYAGGNGGLTIQSNGTQDVTRLSYVTVNVSSSDAPSSETFEHAYFFPMRDAVWAVTDTGKGFEFSGFIVDPEYNQAFSNVAWGEQGTITVESWLNSVFKQTSYSVFVSDNNNIKNNTDVYKSTSLIPATNSSNIALKVGKDVYENMFDGNKAVDTFYYAYKTNGFYYGPDKLNKNITYEPLYYVDLGITKFDGEDVYIVDSIQ